MNHEKINTIIDYFWCEDHGWVDAVIEHGYESGQFPTSYETFTVCPVCKKDVKHGFEIGVKNNANI